jgi:hypothetical protein
MRMQGKSQSLFILYSLVILLALIVVSQIPTTGASAPAPVANAGPDQTVSGPSPVNVQFDGSGSTGEIVSYKWFNQWGQLRAEGVSPVIEVNFGRKNAKPGTTRAFTLIVQDAAGNSAKDKVVITLGKKDDTANQDPIVGSTFTGTTYTYSVSDASRYVFQFIDVGFLTEKGQWYVGNNHSNVQRPQVTCHLGTHWQTDPGDGTVLDDGCIGAADVIVGIGIEAVAMGIEPQYDATGLVRSWQVSYQSDTVATITLADSEPYVFSGASMSINERIEKE